MKRIASCGALLLLLTLVGACTSHRAPGEASLDMTGKVRLTSSSGHVTTVLRPQTVRRGQTIRVERGTATLKFSGDRQIELRRGGIVKVDRVPVVQSGDALLITGARTFTVRAADSTVALTDGAARVGRRLGIETATYKGSVKLTSTGRSLVVPALRQATVPSLGVLPAKPEPLRMQSSDSWDRRFLGTAIELSEELQTRSDALTGQLPRGEGRSAGSIASLLPVLDKESGFGPTLVERNRPTGESVVGASIAASGHTGTFVQRWLSVFSFRDEGAAWGLVALDQKVADVPGLSSSLDFALAKVQSLASQLAAPPAPPAVPTSSPTTPTSPTSPTSPPTVPPSPGGGGGGSPEPAPPEQGVLQPVTDAVGGLVSGLVDLLGGG
jgi:hypothetical protein